MQRVLCQDVLHYLDERVKVMGWIDVVRRIGALNFVVLRDRSGLVQVVWEGKLDSLPPQSVIAAWGIVRQDPRAPGGAEVVAESIELISASASPLPCDFDGRNLSGLDSLLEHRVVSLRGRSARLAMSAKSEFCRVFRDFLGEHGFTEVHTPKIVATGTEGGADLFEVDYFGRKAYLAQSPQLYKQMMVSTGLERVFETGPVFRAEEHATSRHTNEFTSLDLEMGFIDDVEDVMTLEEQLLRRAMHHLRTVLEHTEEQALVPSVDRIPRYDVDEARLLVREVSGHELPEGDLGPVGERLVGEAVLEQSGVEFVFVTGYSQEIRPFYAMPDTANPPKTKTFDLLFRGTEVTTGGQRIHDYNMLLDMMHKRRLEPLKFRGYLEAFKYGMPPHGGLAIGLERFVMKLLRLSNIREACTFPRDRTRLEP